MNDDGSDFTPPPEIRPIRLVSYEEESDVVRALLRGDERALEALMQRYWQGLSSFAARITEDHDRAEDIVQDAFVRLWTRRSKWQRRDTVRPLLYRMVRNAALNERRRQRRAGKWAWKLRRPERDPAPTAQQQVEGAELGELVRRALDTLPPRRREMFVLVRYHRLSHREAAEILDVSPRTVANQVGRAAQDLKELLDPQLADREQPSPPLPFRSRRG